MRSVRMPLLLALVLMLGVSPPAAADGDGLGQSLGHDDKFNEHGAWLSGFPSLSDTFFNAAGPGCARGKSVSYSFRLRERLVIRDTAGNAFEGDINLEGSGGVNCEDHFGTYGTGNLRPGSGLGSVSFASFTSLSASARLDCDNLTGSFSRFRTSFSVRVEGSCSINSGPPTHTHWNGQMDARYSLDWFNGGTARMSLFGGFTVGRESAPHFFCGVSFSCTF